MQDKTIPRFSELMSGPKSVYFCEKYFLVVVEYLKQDGYLPDAIQRGLVNAALASAKEQGQLVNFLMEIRNAAAKQMDAIGDYVIEAEEERRKSAN